MVLETKLLGCVRIDSLKGPRMPHHVIGILQSPVHHFQPSISDSSLPLTLPLKSRSAPHLYLWLMSCQPLASQVTRWVLMIDSLPVEHWEHFYWFGRAFPAEPWFSHRLRLGLAGAPPTRPSFSGILQTTRSWQPPSSWPPWWSSVLLVLVFSQHGSCRLGQSNSCLAWV